MFRNKFSEVQQYLNSNYAFVGIGACGKEAIRYMEDKPAKDMRFIQYDENTISGMNSLYNKDLILIYLDIYDEESIITVRTIKSLLKSKDTLFIAIVKEFKEEGSEKVENTLSEIFDSYICIPENYDSNKRVYEIVYSITEFVDEEGTIPLDFKDFISFTKGKDKLFFAFGEDKDLEEAFKKMSKRIKKGLKNAIIYIYIDGKSKVDELESIISKIEKYMESPDSSIYLAFKLTDNLELPIVSILGKYN